MAKTCTTLKEDMLTNPIKLRIGRENLDFATARLLADQKALETASDPMLLSWYDSRTGRYSPEVECCSEHKPGWVVYAESRGGNIPIIVNDGEYVFIYGDLSTR